MAIDGDRSAGAEGAHLCWLMFLATLEYSVLVDALRPRSAVSICKGQNGASYLKRILCLHVLYSMYCNVCTPPERVEY